ncbi:MAG: zinc ribbon domain-containing protein, partial [Oscillospiraceae bacterium]|nr:zinc ribbon domain-containing protein [Oscillospiraceae bacterium]
KTSRNFHNSDSLVIDGSHEPLIDISVWEQARERAAKRSCGSRRGASNKISHWLTGLARCGICGRPLVNCGGYFYCSGRSKGTCRGNGSIRADVFEKYVLSELERLIGENIVINASKPLKQNTDIYLTQLKRAEARMKRVKEAYEAGIDSMEEYKENKLNIQNEIDSIKSEMQTRSVPEARKKIQPSFMLLSDKSVRESDKNLIAREFIKEIVKTGEDGLQLNIIYKL